MLARLSEIDVSTEGVKGAKSFFEAKVRSPRTVWTQRMCPEPWLTHLHSPLTVRTDFLWVGVGCPGARAPASRAGLDLRIPQGR